MATTSEPSGKRFLGRVGRLGYDTTGTRPLREKLEVLSDLRSVRTYERERDKVGVGRTLPFKVVFSRLRQQRLK